MPIYEYERQDGTRFELRQGFHDTALGVCPTTGQSVRRVISPPGIIFKGSGWYKTDSRPTSSESDSSKSASTASSDASESSASSSSAKADETKTSTKPTESKAASTPAAAD